MMIGSLSPPATAGLSNGAGENVATCFTDKRIAIPVVAEQAATMMTQDIKLVSKQNMPTFFIILQKLSDEKIYALHCALTS